jgi:hypothetical protein
VKTDSYAALEAAKIRRAESNTALKAASVTAAADAADLDVCEGHVADLIGRRAGAIASARPTDVLLIDGELLRARIVVEVAQAKSSASVAKHSAAVSALRQAEAEVGRCAQAQLDSELVELADAVNGALDHACAFGEQLEELCAQNALNTPLNRPSHPLPAAVTSALARLPRPHPLDTPIAVLRSGMQSDARARRLAVLIGDEQIEDVRAA